MRLTVQRLLFVLYNTAADVADLADGLWCKADDERNGCTGGQYHDQHDRFQDQA